MKPENEYKLTHWPVPANSGNDIKSDKPSKELLEVIELLIKNENLDTEILEQFTRIYIPFAKWLAQKHLNRTIVIGISGAQGSGKTTLSKILKTLLNKIYNKSVITLSLDDLYLPKKRREILAKDIHPLLITRGVPGTHDIELGKQIFTKLLKPSPELEVKLPVFNKAIDDLLGEKDWIRVKNKPDIILFEGWCIGARAEPAELLKEAVNELEQYEDPDLIWRNYINMQLKEHYPSLFKFIDYHVMLRVPDMQSVFEWRQLQEIKLKNKQSKAHVMNNNELKRFIMHFERITLSMLQNMPTQAHILLKLNKQHQINDIVVNDNTENC